MHFEIPSYSQKKFIINDNLALIRNPKNLSQFARYKPEDAIPPNASIGQRKLLPLNTKVEITGVKMDSSRNVYVFAKPIDAPDFIPEGWTRCTNLEGTFLNEVIAYVPSEWDLEPTGDNCTTIDKNALIRTGAPNYKSTGNTIAYGSYVEITARSRQTTPEGKYVRIRHVLIEDNAMITGKPIGWTAASNLVAGNSKVFRTDAWLNIKGVNAAWKSGKFIGSKILVAIVGTGGQLQNISLDTFTPYKTLMQAAKNDNIAISINSGFRTYAKQERLYQGWKNGEQGFNLAAKPGRSNHQNGIAFDLNTTGFEGTLVYDWLKNNATKYGFIRTVNKEHWHWEYQPQKAQQLRAQGTFKLTRVKI